MDAAGGNGFLRLLDAGGSIISSMQLARPAATVSGTIMSFNGLSLVDPAAARTGAAYFARIEDSAGNIVISGLTIGTAGSTADIILSTNNIVSGQTVALQQATITGT